MNNTTRHLRAVDNGGGPPDMEARLRQLELDVAVIKETMATKVAIEGLRTELHSSLRAQTMWSVGTIIATAAMVFGLVRILAG